MPKFRKKEEFDGVTAVKETDAALLCSFVGDGDHWIPKSQIDEDSEVNQEGDQGTLVVSAWIAGEKGLV